MEPSGEPIVYGENGLRGRLEINEPLPDNQQNVLIVLDDGARIWVPKDLLEQKQDGRYYLPFNREQLQVGKPEGGDEEGFIIPILAEDLDIQKRRATSGVRIKKEVQEHQETVEDMGFVEHLSIEHIPINLAIDKPAEVRYEGETLIIPIMEERVVLEKRLVLKEEVRVTKTHEPSAPQTVTLREEKARVERFSGSQEE